MAGKSTDDSKRQRSIQLKDVNGALDEIGTLLADAKNNLGKRGKLNSTLSQLDKRVLHMLEIVNQDFPKDFVPLLDELVTAHASVLLAVDRRLGSGERNPARTRLLSIAANLKAQLTKPTMQAYNPLDMNNLAESTARAFANQPVLNLAELKPFEGSGVYAIYYSGPFELYMPISDDNRRTQGSQAIYVGEAGRDKRKGVSASSSVSGKVIYARLEDHKASIQFAKNIEVNDFSR